MQFAYAKYGTASDLAAVSGGSADPRLLLRLVETGIPVGRIHPQVVGEGGVLHSVSFGAGSDIFKYAEAEFNKTGKKSVVTYLKQIPKVLADVFRTGGFDVEIKIDGQLFANKKTGAARFTVAGVLGSSSRVMGDFLGMPAPFDHFRVLLIQPGINLMPNIVEVFARKLLGKNLRFDTLSASKRLWTVP